jgi:steroid delta-isomerase-like uncharacterized protein
VSNKDTTRRFYDEVINQGKLDLIDELVSSDFVEHEEFPGLGNTREAVKGFFTMFRSAFPDMKFTMEDILEDGDKIVVRAMITGTHKGEFMGIPATGKSVRVQAIDMVRFENGKMMEHWGATDTAGMMEQLGVMPTP